MSSLFQPSPYQKQSRDLIFSFPVSNSIACPECPEMGCLEWARAQGGDTQLPKLRLQWETGCPSPALKFFGSKESN